MALNNKIKSPDTPHIRKQSLNPLRGHKVLVERDKKVTVEVRRIGPRFVYSIFFLSN